MALPIVMGLGLFTGCGPLESSSPGTTTTETTETGETTETTTETGETMDTTTSSELTTSMTTTTTTTPTETVDACPEDPTPEGTTEEFVVFARADAPEAPGEGTREKPFTSLQAAIDAGIASNKQVFACSGAPFQESVVIGAPVDLRGGFDCDQGWIYDPLLRSSILGAPDTVAMTITKPASGSSVVGWQIEAPDAVAPGASAVALVVARLIAPTFLCRCDLMAGNGTDGVDGETWEGAGPAPSGADAAQPGEPGGPSDACADPAVFQAGLGGVTQCDEGPTDGGLGGLGGIPPNGSGNDGGDGVPSTPGFRIYGSGGHAGCTDGYPGLPGKSTVNGKGGGPKTELLLTGVKNLDGTPGQHGQSGSGGGAGGGRSAVNSCGPQALPGYGASGGGGGAGGCGGKAGGGGTAGGSSVGLVALGGDLYVKATTFTTGAGGDGGVGGYGQPGGAGGIGAPGGKAVPGAGNSSGCAGAFGGYGTAGGRGGGGYGGDSVSLIRYGFLSQVVLEDCDYFHGPAGKGGGDLAAAQLGLKGYDGSSTWIRIIPEP